MVIVTAKSTDALFRVAKRRIDWVGLLFDCLKGLFLCDRLVSFIVKP